MRLPCEAGSYKARACKYIHMHVHAYVSGPSSPRSMFRYTHQWLLGRVCDYVCDRAHGIAGGGASAASHTKKKHTWKPFYDSMPARESQVSTNGGLPSAQPSHPYTSLQPRSLPHGNRYGYCHQSRTWETVAHLCESNRHLVETESEQDRDDASPPRKKERWAPPAHGRGVLGREASDHEASHVTQSTEPKVYVLLFGLCI